MSILILFEICMQLMTCSRFFCVVETIGIVDYTNYDDMKYAVHLSCFFFNFCLVNFFQPCLRGTVALS
jgi:hypothetical protein